MAVAKARAKAEAATPAATRTASGSPAPRLREGRLLPDSDDQLLPATRLGHGLCEALRACASGDSRVTVVRGLQRAGRPQVRGGRPSPSPAALESRKPRAGAACCPAGPAGGPPKDPSKILESTPSEPKSRFLRLRT